MYYKKEPTRHHFWLSLQAQQSSYGGEFPIEETLKRWLEISHFHHLYVQIFPLINFPSYLLFLYIFHGLWYENEYVYHTAMNCYDSCGGGRAFFVLWSCRKPVYVPDKGAPPAHRHCRQECQHLAGRLRHLPNGWGLPRRLLHWQIQDHLPLIHYLSHRMFNVPHYLWPQSFPGMI